MVAHAYNVSYRGDRAGGSLVWNQPLSQKQNTNKRAEGVETCLASEDLSQSLVPQENKKQKFMGYGSVAECHSI
jgi:hypothetical protein